MAADGASGVAARVTSGAPAGVVSGGEPLNRSRIRAIAAAIQSGRHSDGVPPPR